MQIVAFIPARSGSKSILNKNIKLLGGKPLIAWSIKTALSVGLRTIVHSDSKEYLDIAEEYGAETMYIDPEEARKIGIHQDNSSMYQLLRSEIPKINPTSDVVVLFQPTSPFRDSVEINNAIREFKDNYYDSLIGVEEVPEKYNPAQVIVESSHRSFKYCLANQLPISKRIIRRQDFPNAYIPTGSLYIFNTKNFVTTGSIYGLRPMIYEMKPTININTIDDWREAENYLKNYGNYN